MNAIECSVCQKPLKKVEQSPDSMLNEQQFAAIRAGDYYCEKCDGIVNRYFWKKEIEKLIDLFGK